MTEPTDRCPKCDGAMEQGFVMAKEYARRATLRWVPGPHRSSFWSPVALPNAPTHPVGTFRCASCGYLESYARPEFEVRT